MRHINELTTVHCREGVEFKRLDEVGDFVRGNGLQRNDFVEEGFPCIHYGQIYTFYGTSTRTTKSFVSSQLAGTLKTAQPGDLIVTTTSENAEDVCTSVAWLGDGPVAIGGHSCVYRHSLDPMYVAYYFQTDHFEMQKRKFVSGTKVKDIRVSDIGRIKIPVPPPAIQREISSILDKMEWLETELETELEFRFSQRDFYRERLMSFDGVDDMCWMPMGEVGEFFRGKRFTKRDYVNDGIPCIHYGEVYTEFGSSTSTVVSHVRSELRSSLRFARPGDVVIVDVGETVEDVGKAVAWLGDGEVAVHDHCYVFRHDMNPAFVSYYMQTARFHAEKAKHVARTKVKTLLMNGLAKVMIPVPPREEQDRIVAILDKFDALVTDLSAGLPAEIAARRTQYKYYRDKLLTFPEKEAT